MGEARGSEAEMTLAFEATYGTTPASGFIQMPFLGGALGEEIALIEDDTLGLGRDPQAPTQDVNDDSGDMTLPVDVAGLGYWLTLLLGTPTTTGASAPYTHVWTSGAAALPSASIEMGWPGVPRFDMHYGVKAGTFALDARRGRGQNLSCTVGLMGKGMAPATSTQSGTPTEHAYERFEHGHCAIQRDASALAGILSCGVNFTNNLEPLEAITADGEVPSITEGMTGATGTLVQRFANTTLLTQAAGGGSCALKIEYTIAAAKKLTIDLPRVFLGQPKILTNTQSGIDVSYPWMAAQQADGDPMMTVTLINAIASYNGSGA
jgi:hypothetical protein